MVGSLLLTQLESVCSSAQGMSLSEHSLNAECDTNRWQILINKKKLLMQSRRLLLFIVLD